MSFKASVLLGEILRSHGCGKASAAVGVSAGASTSDPYRDDVGKLTIGVGRNLDDRGLSADEIDVLLANDISIARAGCRALFPAFDGFNSKRQAGLISMAFNLGQTRLAGFRRMRAAINDGNWTGASTEALDSYWAGQVGRCASEIAALLRSSE